MGALEQLNQAFRQEFKKERLSLITEWKAEKVEALDELRIVDAYWTKPNEFYRLVLKHGGGRQFNYDVGTRLYLLTSDEKLIIYSWEESRKIERFLLRLNDHHYVSRITEEKQEDYFQQAKQNRMQAVIVDIKRENGEIRYTLSNGNSFTEQIPGTAGRSLKND